MTTRTAYLSVLTVTALVVALAAAPANAHDRPGRDRGAVDRDVRIATFDASLNRSAEGDLAADLSSGDDEQARSVAPAR